MTDLMPEVELDDLKARLQGYWYQIAGTGEPIAAEVARACKHSRFTVADGQRLLAEVWRLRAEIEAMSRRAETAERIVAEQRRLLETHAEVAAECH